MSRIRIVVFTVAALAFLATPRASLAQIDLTSTCTAATTSPCSFFISRLEATTRPIELAWLELELGDGWSLTTTQAVAAVDLFGPLPPSLFAGFGDTDSGVFVDFLAALNPPGSCFPFDPIACPIFGFAVGGPLSPPTFLDLFLTPPTDAPDLQFAWRATDIDGTVYESEPLGGDGDGSGDGDAVTAGEPAAWLLLAFGLGALGFVTRRRPWGGIASW